ncbi:MAG: lactonase family protein [Pirellula sp.]|jgi:6-phosphogluconolactonase
MKVAIKRTWRSSIQSIIGLFCFSIAMTHTALGESLNVWLGTGRSPQSRGIYHCKLDTSNGKLTEPKLVAEMEGPGFLAKHPKLPVLYAVGGIKNEQVVAAFAIADDGKSPSLTFMNAVSIGDGGAAHVAVDATGRTLLTAQYGGGSVASFALGSDGSITARTKLIKHEGGSRVVSNRQDASHAHWAGVSPDNKFAFVPDLGLDRVVIYKLDPANSSIEPHGEGVTPPGSGPRHMKFHPNGRWIYVLNELSLTVTQFEYDATKGAMTPVQTVETVPAVDLAREKAKSASEIRVHPNGKYVYSANRGHDSISVFEIEASSGNLKRIQIENARAITPRNFNVSPSGDWLLVAGQASHTLAAFSVESDSGRVVFNQNSVYAPSTICVMFDDGK